MATEESDKIDKELIEEGIKDTSNSDIGQTYETLMKELSNDPSKGRLADFIKSIYIGFKTSTGNEMIYNRLYKNLRKRYAEEVKRSKMNLETQKEEIESLNRKCNELIEAQNIAKEGLKQKEQEKNDFTIEDKRDEPEIDEALVQELRRLNEQLTDSLKEKEERLQQAEEAAENLREKVAVLNVEKENLREEKIKVEKDFKTAKEIELKENENKENEIKKIKEMADKHKKDYDEECKLHESEKEKLNKAKEELTSLKKNNESLETEKENYKKLLNQKKDAIEKLEREKKIIIQREKEAIELRKEVEKDKKLLEKQSRDKGIALKESENKISKMNEKIKDLTIEKSNCENEIAKTKEELSGALKEIEKKEQEIQVEQSIKEKTRKELEAERGLKEKQTAEYTRLNEAHKTAMTQLTKNKQQLNVLDKNYRDLERARNKSTEENTKLKNKIDHLLEDIKLGDNRVQELQKKVAEYEKKLKMQREVYDAARRDKNLYFKNLIETQDDLVERQNLLQFNKKEIENLKSDLKKKDDYIVDIKGKNSKFEKQIKVQEIDNTKLKSDLEARSKMCQAQEKEMEKLKINVEETAKNYSKLENEYKKTIIDRDNLSSQLIRRNDEVSILHEKIMILTTDMSKLEKKIQEKVDSLSIQERTIQNLSRELKINQKFKEKSEACARELVNIHKELLREKNLNKALTEEVESSEKLFHRWRKLEGIDPDSLELHYKISLLQKRLISKTEECIEKEITIQDLTKELANCKKLANKKPLFEIEESIKKYKQELSKQYDRMKATIAELNMYRNQVEEVKADNNKMKKENIDLQNKYHELKIRTNRMVNAS